MNNPPTLIPATAQWQAHGAMLAQLANIAHIALPQRKQPPASDWWIDGNGQARHVDDVPAYVRLREEALRPLLENHVRLYLELADHRARLEEVVSSLVAVCWQEYQIKIEGPIKKGMTLRTYDGSLALRRTFRDRTGYDESIGAAEAKINEFLKEKMADVPEEVKALVNSAFVKNKEGDIRRSEMLRLRQHKFEHPLWQEAMQIIADAEQVLSAACYFTVLIQDSAGTDQPLPLDLACARPHKMARALPVRPIRTEEDYRAALAEVEHLMTTKPGGGSPDGNRLEVWAVLVEDYERRHSESEVPE